MKKIVSILLVLVTVLSMGTMAFADGTTTLTTTVPPATYTLNIPADQTVDFNSTRHDIETPTITNESGFAVGKNVVVEITHTAFTNPAVNTTIPFIITAKNTDSKLATVNQLCFFGKSDGGVGSAEFKYSSENWAWASEMYLVFSEADWGKALGGDYTATITFISEVVAQ